MALFLLHRAAAFLLPQFLFSLTLVSYSDQGQYFINCGSSIDIHLNDGRTFVGDDNPSNFSWSGHRSSTVQNRDQSVNNSDSLYHTARVFKNPSTYDFDMSNSTIILRFHFYAFSSSPQLADAQFNVSVAGHMLLSNFSVGKNATNSPVLKEFFFLSNNTGKFRIYFVPNPQTSSLAFINAIEILTTSQNITQDTGPLVTPQGSNKTYNGQKSKVLETIYRINVGGQNVPDELYRTWTPDAPYLINNKVAKTNGPRDTGFDRVNGQATVDDAPDAVYSTAKVLNNSNFNLTWQFSINKSAIYFVRAHFCDIISLQLSLKSFNLYIYENYAQQIEPYEIVDQLAVPFYKDYIVESGDAGVLNVSIGSNTTNDTYAFLNGLEIMQVKNGTASTPTDSNSASHVALVIGLVSAGMVVAVISVVVVVCLCRKKKKAKPTEPFEWAMVPLYGGTSSHNKTPNRSFSHASNLSNLHLGLKIPFAEIQLITRNFDTSLLIGEGGFGQVYKGSLKDGRKVAVKRGNSDHGQGLLEFLTEIMVLSKIRHRHLVSLIGYCYEDCEMILVYEFMEGGTLREHLYDSTGSSNSSSHASLSWKQRLEICIGAARGLDYLHTGSERGIIHRDVKSTNILLDENYVAKVADFGLSTSGHLDRTHVSTDIKGTFGYLDPEYFRSWHLTEKSDVYSFGVVLLEVLCARTVLDRSLPKEQVNLADWAMTWHNEGQLKKIVDPLLLGEINENSLKKFGQTAAKCLKENTVERPPMSDVVWDLEYALQLQKSTPQREQQEDSMTDTSFNLPLPVVRRFPSLSLFNNEDELALTGTATMEVFSQLRFDDDTVSGI